MCTPIATESARTLTTAGHQSVVDWPPSHTRPSRTALSGCWSPVRSNERWRSPPVDETVHGNRRERVRQLGNGVTPPAAEWLVGAAVASLERSGGRRRTAA